MNVDHCQKIHRLFHNGVSLLQLYHYVFYLKFVLS